MTIYLQNLFTLCRFRIITIDDWWWL